MLKKHIGVAYSATLHSLPLTFPKKFHSLEVQLVDCSFSQNQSLSPGNGSTHLNNFLISGDGVVDELPKLDLYGANYHVFYLFYEKIVREREED